MYFITRNTMTSACVIATLLCIVLQRCTITSGSTHWIVTEDGKVQSQADSVFNLRRPYDLVAFLKQEDRATMLNDLKKELLSRKDEIDRNEDRDTGLEQKFYKTNPDCIEAGKRLPEFDLYISTVLPLENKGIRPEEHIDINAAPTSNPKAPDCSDFMDLDFSMHAFEHLEGMKSRSNLSGTAELGLKNAITHRENVDDYGHLVYEALHKNKTSWVLYNMAAFYWRIKGNTHQAVECIRRALHLSPRLQKDVALISLANILHRARFCNEAAILVHSALEVSKELNVNHFTLGNIYAVLGEYNKSIICFENTLKIQPDFEAAAKRRHAVLCHSKLEQALEAQHRSLQRTLQDLKDYQRKHDLYQTQSDKLLSEQIPHEMKIAQHVAYEQQRMREQMAEKDEYCRMVDRNGKQVLLCKWGRRSPTLDLDFAFMEEEPVDLQQPPSATNETPKVDDSGDEVTSTVTSSSSVDYSLPVKAPLYSKYKKYKPSESDSYTQESWPDKDECDNLVKQVPDPRNLTTVYLSPENKGFEVKELLTEAQGLSPGGQHPLPWYPPVCVPLLEMEEGNPAVYDHLKSVSYTERSRIPLKYNDPSMLKILLSLANEGSVTVEEVGQRILTALKKHIGPQWILYNLAGLYWRIIGNNFHGIECLRRSIHLCPGQYKDIPLVNLANILYRYGRYDDAIIIMRDALEVSDVEPSTHFLMGHLLWATRNFTGAAHHYQEALSMEPSLVAALDSLRAMKCYLKFHYAAQSAAPQESPAVTVGTNCPPKGKETENRVICKTENNEEKCIIETRTRNRNDCNGQCTQTCTISPIKLDACGSDFNLENAIIGHCSGKGGKTFSSEQEDILFSGDFTSRLDDVSDHYEKKGVCHGDECGHLRVQCLLPMTTHSGLIAHVITPPKLFVRPVSFHASQCLSPSQQTFGPKPHTKLEYVEGVLRHKLIFLQVLPSEMEVSEEECVIFNDGTKSPGCSREEFQTYITELEQDALALKKMASGFNSGKRFWKQEDPWHYQAQVVADSSVPSMKSGVDEMDGKHRQEREEEDEEEKRTQEEDDYKERVKVFFNGLGEDLFEDEDADEELHIHWLTPEEEAEYERHFSMYSREVNSFSVSDHHHHHHHTAVLSGEGLLHHSTDETKKQRVKIECKREKNEDEEEEKRHKEKNRRVVQMKVSLNEKKGGADDRKTVEMMAEPLDSSYSSSYPQAVVQPQPVKFDPRQTPDDQLPNTHVHLRKREMPVMTACEKGWLYEEDFFPSTLIALEDKGIQVSEWMEFPSECPDVQEDPVCPEGLASPAMSMDHLPGVAHRAGSKHWPESDLHETLINLPGERVTTCQIKNILVEAMASNSSSWMAYYLSGMYWRVQGNPRHSLDCLRVAITYAPYHYRDVPLVAMANVLHHTSYTNDAIVTVNTALHVCDTLPVTHFTMAMLYVAKSDFDNYVLFLQARLAHCPTASEEREATATQLQHMYCTDMASSKVYTLPGQGQGKKHKNE